MKTLNTGLRDLTKKSFLTLMVAGALATGCGKDNKVGNEVNDFNNPTNFGPTGNIGSQQYGSVIQQIEGRTSCQTAGSNQRFRYSVNGNQLQPGGGNFSGGGQLYAGVNDGTGDLIFISGSQGNYKILLSLCDDRNNQTGEPIIGQNNLTQFQIAQQFSDDDNGNCSFRGVTGAIGVYSQNYGWVQINFAPYNQCF